MFQKKQKRTVRNRTLETVSVAKEVPAQIVRPAMLAFPGGEVFRMEFFPARPAGSEAAFFQTLGAFLTFTVRRKAQNSASRIKSTESPVSKLFPVVGVFQKSPRVHLGTAENFRRFMRCQKVTLHSLPYNAEPRRSVSKRIVRRFPFQRRFVP